MMRDIAAARLFLVLGSWFLVLGSWFLVPSSWFLVLRSWLAAVRLSLIRHHSSAIAATRHCACGAASGRGLRGLREPLS